MTHMNNKNTPSYTSSSSSSSSTSISSSSSSSPTLPWILDICLDYFSTLNPFFTELKTNLEIDFKILKFSMDFFSVQNGFSGDLEKKCSCNYSDNGGENVIDDNCDTNNNDTNEKSHSNSNRDSNINNNYNNNYNNYDNNNNVKSIKEIIKNITMENNFSFLSTLTIDKMLEIIIDCHKLMKFRNEKDDKRISQFSENSTKYEISNTDNNDFVKKRILLAKNSNEIFGEILLFFIKCENKPILLPYIENLKNTFIFAKNDLSRKRKYSSPSSSYGSEMFNDDTNTKSDDDDENDNNDDDKDIKTKPSSLERQKKMNGKIKLNAINENNNINEDVIGSNSKSINFSIISHFQYLSSSFIDLYEDEYKKYAIDFLFLLIFLSNTTLHFILDTGSAALLPHHPRYVRTYLRTFLFFVGLLFFTVTAFLNFIFTNIIITICYIHF